MKESKERTSETPKEEACFGLLQRGGSVVGQTVVGSSGSFVRVVGLTSRPLLSCPSGSGEEGGSVGEIWKQEKWEWIRRLSVR